MKFIVNIALLFLLLTPMAKAFAQTSGSQTRPTGITVFLGPTANYFHGLYEEGPETWDSGKLNFQLNGFIGYTSAHSRGTNIVGVFGTGGYTNEETFQEMLAVQELSTDELKINKYFTFYQAEAGMILGNILRLSTGFGRQDFETVNGRDKLYYFSSTAGLLIGLGSFSWNIDANIQYGRDFANTSIRFSSGLMIKF